MQDLDESLLNEAKQTKEQKYAMFAGANTKNQLYIKNFNGKVLLVRVEKWRMSGQAINDLQGSVGMLTARTSAKTNKPHYYIINFSFSFANNLVEQDMTPLKNEDAKKLAKKAGYDMSKFKDLEDAPDAKDFGVDPIFIDQKKASNGLKTLDETLSERLGVN